MLQRALRSWGRFVGWPSKPAPAVLEERRVWLRYPCNLQTTVQPANVPETVRLSGRVLDISRGGIKLRVNQPFEPGALLSVDLPGENGTSSSTVLAYVVRVAAQPGSEWSVGCTFATELGDEDLQLFGAKRQKAPEPDQRTWVRFSCNARASFQVMRGHEPQALPAKVLNLSPTGICLLAGLAVDVGSLLSVELHGARGQAALTIMASVVRVTAQAGNEWGLGCNFIRELNDHELQGLV
jgi:hypothetical protein